MIPVNTASIQNQDLLHQVLTALQKVLKHQKLPVSLHQPVFEGREKEYVEDCIKTGWVSSVGSYVDRFETQLAQYTGVKKAIAVVNGTAALHTALILAEIQAGDEVLVPTLTFVATANAVVYANAIPHWVDSNSLTLGVDPEKLDRYLSKIGTMKSGQLYNRLTNRPIKALIGVHTFGHPFAMDKTVEVCRKYKIILIEDAAESLGSFYKGKHTGNWGEIAVLSFNGNKIVTTGGGGAILTNNEALARRAKHITTTAKVPHSYFIEHDQVGYNYRLPNLNAALGCAQLESLEKFIQAKRALALQYDAAFANILGISFFREPHEAKSNYWLNAILIDESLSHQRDFLLEATNNEGFGTRPCWTLMHKLPMFQNFPKMDLSIAEQIEKRLINIPSSANLSLKQ